MWSFRAAWELLTSAFGLAGVIGGIAVTVAVLTPRWLAWVTDLRKWAIVVAVCAFGFMALSSHYFAAGLATKQAEWDAALAREKDNGEQIRKDAENAVRPVDGDDARRLLRSDPYNRDRGAK